MEHGRRRERLRGGLFLLLPDGEALRSEDDAAEALQHQEGGQRRRREQDPVGVHPSAPEEVTKGMYKLTGVQ